VVAILNQAGDWIVTPAGETTIKWTLRAVAGVAVFILATIATFFAFKLQNSLSLRAAKKRKKRHEEEEQAKREQKERAKREEEIRARREQKEHAKREEEERAKREQEERAKREEEIRARREQKEHAKREEEERAKREQEERAKREEEERAKREQEERAKREQEERAKRVRQVVFVNPGAPNSTGPYTTKGERYKRLSSEFRKIAQTVKYIDNLVESERQISKSDLQNFIKQGEQAYWVLWYAIPGSLRKDDKPDVNGPIDNKYFSYFKTAINITYNKGFSAERKVNSKLPRL